MYTKMEAVERKFQEKKLKRLDKHRDFVVEQATMFLTSLNDLVAPLTEKKLNQMERANQDESDHEVRFGEEFINSGQIKRVQF